MRIRARHIHAIETLVDNVLGLVINFWVSQLFLVHVLNIPFTYTQNAALSAVMFVIAYIRKYTLRRYSSGLIQKIYEGRK
jgi:uncharacterized protein YacL